MKPAFALSLSFEGITLLHRAAGGWRQVGAVALDAPDLAAALRKLRQDALRLEPDIRCKLILPNEQIRYLTVETGPFKGEARHALIEKEVGTATPYALEELAYDTSPDGELTHVAAVARETLNEAEAFATEHGFNPVSFVAAPGDNPFLGEPFFGPSSTTAESTGAEAVEPDGIAVVVIGPAVFPDTEPPAAPAAPPVSFSSRRTKATGEMSEDDPAPAPPPVAPAVTEEPDVPAPVAEAPEAPEPEAAVQAAVASEFASRRTLAPDAPRPILDEMPVTAFAAAERPQQVPRTEADRLTIFGARSGGIGGKPRYLGVMLTVGLLLFLAAVAAFASLFSPGGLTGLFRDPDPLAEPPAAAVEAPAPTPETAPEQVAPPTPASIDEDPEDLVAPQDVPELPGLSGTDSAVLEALRTDPQQVEDLDYEPEPSGTQATELALSEAPEPPEVPGLIGLNDLFVASIDRTDLFQDAVALPPVAGFDTDAAPDGSAPSSTPGQSFDLDTRGLVEASPEGTLNPDGVLVYAGRPVKVPPAPPVRFEAPPEVDVAQERLASVRPKLRPGDLVEQSERSQFGGRSLSELAGLRPKARPVSLQEQLAEQQEADPEEAGTVSPLAVASARKPRLRPEKLAAAAAAAAASSQGNLGSTAGLNRSADADDSGSFTAATVKPKAPSPTSVARQATLDNAINLRDLNLIGVYGTPANRRALVRLPSGRYKKVKVGDSIDGGRITAIGDSELRYQKGSRNLTLKIPSG
ncbi:hypothetical protein KQ247_15955 [Ruegeria pomeroyi]|uniref:Type IV pilus biogenesis protein PilP n=2 Tax=Ruegeria pomeroyi TaxID=89184 RepID=Q5LTI7_RUEPO|nr:hypothetical protein [Ruegeria pomeroyi]AAV94714.1 hypothetical protein SPO1427 [Ruegeria pomeroyi DSS-3]NVK95845.1 hypothetical protein [Ruegeria pomeroyi]NVL00176.1 hypothetical protein [Ruegeria pomeroyi]QWV08298.1 hypothetical protein KQ247_15955 [Ruegeria pomeroyi]